MSRRLLPALGWASAFLFALALHLQGILSHRWNSDEPQHLHVVRGWAVGLLPYRDVFDNHAPLFSFLCSPLFRLFGETPRIVELMRLAMVPLFLLTLWCIFCLGRALVSVRAGLWGSLFASLWPSWSVKMIEFRADILWTALWLLALTLLLTGRMNRQRAFLAGLAFGACFSTSLKTTLLLANLLAAGSAALLYLWRTRTPAQPFPTREILRLGGCFLAGMCVLPAAWIAFFSVTGNLSAFRYCLITHNLVPKAEKTVRHYKRAAWIATVAVMVLLAARVPLARWIPDRGKQTRLLLLLFLNVSFYPLLRGLWTMITPQDFLPISPIFALSTGLVCAALTRERGRFLPLAVAAGLAVLLVKRESAGPPPEPQPGRRTRRPAAALPAGRIRHGRQGRKHLPHAPLLLRRGNFYPPAARGGDIAGHPARAACRDRDGNCVSLTLISPAREEIYCAELSADWAIFSSGAGAGRNRRGRTQAGGNCGHR